ncbi:helix-turn-helix transcriptional regulator [Rhodopila sp.]|uniref:helix-turn-helix transcriptional regulator n=1 Tax=Rhodopila sp. TaxID=2480087 RepID=UPI002C694647|nr:AraC family transcriptional regulator [Rhodopila sp.]HVZ07587.1 AraC family transcriptional regulator [Rhodopila sp.]
MIRFDASLLESFERAAIRADDIDIGGRFTRKLAVLNGVMSYRLRKSGTDQTGGDGVVSVQAVRPVGRLRPAYNADRLATDIQIIGDGQPHLYGFVMMLSGAAQMLAGPNGTATAHGGTGMILRGLADTRLTTTDDSARLVLWIETERIERALTAWLGEPPRRDLAFMPEIDWTVPPAGAVRRLIDHLLTDLRDPLGLASDPVAVATFTDLLLQAILHRLPHNHSDRLQGSRGVAIPAHLRRAEMFMDASADQPISLTDVAQAAGCSLSTMRAAFRRFRDTTPLAALQEVRLRHVRRALASAPDDVPTRVIARRFGFSNPSRFIAAYGRRFGEHPAEARQRAEAPGAAGTPET